MQLYVVSHFLTCMKYCNILVRIWKRAPNLILTTINDYTDFFEHLSDPLDIKIPNYQNSSTIIYCILILEICSY